MLLLLAYSLDFYGSLSWASEDHGSGYGELFSGSPSWVYGLSFQRQGWVLGAELGWFPQTANYEWDDDAVRVDTITLVGLDLRAGRAFALPAGFELEPWLGLGLWHYAVDRALPDRQGPYPPEGTGLLFPLGLRAAWGPPSWNAKLQTGFSWRRFPGWYPELLRARLEWRVGLRFNVFSR